MDSFVPRLCEHLIWGSRREFTLCACQYQIQTLPGSTQMLAERQDITGWISHTDHLERPLLSSTAFSVLPLFGSFLASAPTRLTITSVTLVMGYSSFECRHTEMFSLTSSDIDTSVAGSHQAAHRLPKNPYSTSPTAVDTGYVTAVLQLYF